MVRNIVRYGDEINVPWHLTFGDTVYILYSIHSVGRGNCKMNIWLGKTRAQEWQDFTVCGKGRDEFVFGEVRSRLSNWLIPSIHWHVGALASGSMSWHDDQRLLWSFLLLAAVVRGESYNLRCWVRLPGSINWFELRWFGECPLSRQLQLGVVGSINHIEKKFQLFDCHRRGTI